jgi:hypothetical protein
MDGVLLTMAQEGVYVGWCNPPWRNLSVDVLRAGKCCERLCGDLQAVHQRKCMLGKMEVLLVALLAMKSPTHG